MAAAVISSPTPDEVTGGPASQTFSITVPAGCTAFSLHVSAKASVGIRDSGGLEPKFDGDSLTKIGGAKTGGSSDQQEEVWGFVNPAEKTADIVLNYQGPNGGVTCKVVFYNGTETSSIVAVFAEIDVDTDDAGTTDTATLVSGGSAGDLVVVSGNHRGNDGDPATVAGFTILHNSDNNSGTANNDHAFVIAHKAAPSGATIVWQTSDELAAYSLRVIGAASSSLVLSDVTSVSFAHGNTFTLDGENFEAVQGGGFVKISPTDDINDVGAVTQTIDSWGDQTIQCTLVRGSLNLDDTVYVFVENDSGDSNAAGFAIQLVPNVTLQISEAITFVGSMTQQLIPPPPAASGEIDRSRSKCYGYGTAARR